MRHNKAMCIFYMVCLVYGHWKHGVVMVPTLYNIRAYDSARLCRRFEPPFLTFWGLNSIFWGTFSHPPTPKRSFGVLKLQILTKFDLFGPKIPPKFHFSLDLLDLIFISAAHPWWFETLSRPLWRQCNVMINSSYLSRPPPLWYPVLLFRITLFGEMSCWNHINKQRVLMHGHQGWNVRHGLCHIYMTYVYIYELFIAFVCFVFCSLL